MQRGVRIALDSLHCGNPRTIDEVLPSGEGRFAGSRCIALRQR
jgi:hypothetical protein